jgi:hypothetical protein
MTVYVDDMKAPFKPGHVKGRTYVMCHMIADSDAELHAMADRIGVARKWHQAPPAHDSHYDIALSKRVLAVQAGAREITLRQLACMSTYRKITGQKLPMPETAQTLLCEALGVRRAKHPPNDSPPAG